ncbi:MAG: hypothetical protein LBG52_00355 [Candidatus Peribacteria bacterium]|jgi:hypothetical protein|nr:hypothetical protein [Candidatus Peribacteria bacterium]
MKDWYQDILSNEPTVDAKRLQSFLKNFKKPDIQPSWMFKDQMKKRLNKKMQEKKRQEEVSMLATIPFFVKWRFGLTGFAIATCGFLFIFLLTFFSDFF